MEAKIKLEQLDKQYKYDGNCYANLVEQVVSATA